MATIRARGKQCVVFAFACAFAASSAIADEKAHTPLQVWAIGLPNGYVVMEHQARGIHISAEDVERGYVEVREGSRLIVALRSPGGYAVDFRSVSGIIRDARIGGIGDAIEIETSGGTAVQWQAASGRHVVAIDYRFRLAPGTVSGSYAWPLVLAVRIPLSGDRAQSADAFPLASAGRR
jgi:hypothetical protein